MPFLVLRKAVAVLAAACVALTTVAGAQALRDGAPSCGGRDLLPELRARGAEVAQRLDAAAAAMVNAKAILWRIEKEGVPPSHIFGTVHVSDDRVNALTPAIETAIDGSRVVALEIADLSPKRLVEGIAKVKQLLEYPHGQSLETQLAPDELSVARDAMQKAGMPPAALAKLRPWVVTMSIALTECERQRTAGGLKPLDERLGIRADARRIQVISLETVEDQMRAMAAVPEADQLALLKAGLKLHHLTPDMIETLIRRYLASDLGMIWAVQSELWREHGVGEAAAGAFMRELVVVRNKRMRDTVMPYVAKGGTFIAVGALHLPGKDGLVALFQEAGYKATPVE
ncbi:MAG: TraB/GumN family protein [Hyphomicrobiaceae bacterium]